MTQHRRYRALYDYEARDDKDLSMKTGDLLLVKQQPDGTWPSAEKWMLGTNETTSQHGDFPGGEYVEFVEYVLPKPLKPPSTKPKPSHKRAASVLNHRQPDIDDSKSELLKSHDSGVVTAQTSINTRTPQPQLTSRPQQLHNYGTNAGKTTTSEKIKMLQDVMGKKNGEDAKIRIPATTVPKGTELKKHPKEEDEMQSLPPVLREAPQIREPIYVNKVTPQSTEPYTNGDSSASISSSPPRSGQGIVLNSASQEKELATQTNTSYGKRLAQVEGDPSHVKETHEEQRVYLNLKEQLFSSASAPNSPLLKRHFKSTEADDEMRKKTQAQMTNAFQVQEDAIQSTKVDEMRSSQLQREASTQIRELTISIQVKEDAILSAEAKVEDEKKKSSKLQREAQAQIKELNIANKVKEDAIHSAQAEIEDEKRKSSQLQRELTVALQVKEAVIQSAETELENERKEFSEQQRDTQAQIRELMTAIQVKEYTIQEKEDELQDKEDKIQKKSEQIVELQRRVNEEESNSIQTNISKKAWNIPRAQIQGISKQEIGHGAWGVVYSGTFQQEPVAIKYAHKDLLHTTTIDMLKREVMIMANIQHPNLVRFVGAVFDNAVERGRDTPIILSERMDMNLRTAYKKKNLSSSLISIFRDVAYALHYLHQYRHPIIHCNISAPNVLLKSLRHGGYQAKVSDFRSTNLVKQSTTAGAGAIVYCAPEMFPNEDITAPSQPQTTKVDVFSYGILFLEVVVKEIPNPATRYTILQQVKDKCQRELIVQCTKPLPSDRPAMTDILDSLHKMH